VDAGDADSAYAAIAARWGQRYERRPGEQPCDAVRRGGLGCLSRRGSWNLVRRFDVPVVLELASPSGPRFLAVTAADERGATVQVGARTEFVPLDQLEREWDGGFVLLWRPPRAGMQPIGRGAGGGDVAWLRQRLGAIDREAVPARAARTYDDALAARVTAFQRAHGLHPDGIAGDETLAKLTAMLDPATPSLRRAP
jgi:general secretion pathway protein A